MEKPATNEYPILDVIQRRWSPRAFDDRLVEPQKIRRLFDAMRWAPSSFNEQPWRFILGTRDDPEQYDKVLGCLVEMNQQWAQTAPLLGLTLAKKTFSKNGKPNRVHVHDVGLAMSSFVLQAMDMDLFVHQMAGIDQEAVMRTFEVPDDFEPVAGVAVGYAGDAGRLPEQWMRDAEQSQRTRAGFDQFVFGRKFGEPADTVKGQ